MCQISEYETYLCMYIIMIDYYILFDLSVYFFGSFFGTSFSTT